MARHLTKAEAASKGWFCLKDSHEVVLQAIRCTVEKSGRRSSADWYTALHAVWAAREH